MRMRRLCRDLLVLRCLLLVSMRMVHNCRTLSCCADLDIMRNHQGRSIDTMPRLLDPVARVPKPNYKMNISRYLLFSYAKVVNDARKC